MLLFFLLGSFSFFETLVVVTPHSTQAPRGYHVCEHLTKYLTPETRTFSRTVREDYTTCCERFIFCMKYCKRHKYKTVYYTKKVAVHKHEVIKECCHGWYQSGSTCFPICTQPCIHGTCIQPDFCACADGYNGMQCQNRILVPTTAKIIKPTTVDVVGELHTDRNTNGDVDGNNNNNNSKKNGDDSFLSNEMWAWMVPTVLFILILTGMIIVYRRRRESIYRQTTRTHLVPRSKVSYKSFTDEEEDLTVDLYDNELDDEAKGKNNLIVDLGDHIKMSPASVL